MAVHTKIVTKGKLISDSGFQGYDVCLNSYVGCQHGCSYCYVRFFIRDKEHPWGDFLRLRRHIAAKLPGELKKNVGKRLVMGTMCDPYQPAEETELLTQTALQIFLAQPVLKRVGIFTKAVLVQRDQSLIEQLPDPSIHMTLTPYPDDVIRVLERETRPLSERLAVLQRFQDGGKVKVCVNVAPMLPGISDEIVPELITKLLQMGVHQFFIDPMQVYADSLKAVHEAMTGRPGWSATREVLLDETRYKAWKAAMAERCTALVRASANKTTRPVLCDHVHKVWRDMRTGQDIDQKTYQV